MNSIRLIKQKFKWIQSIILALFLGCAAQGPASGGPADIEGPIVINIVPENGKVNIPADTKFVLQYDELIDPLSVPAAISIIPDIEYRIKIRKEKLAIIPKAPLPEATIIRVSISRRVRDYRRNEMDSPINLMYSTGAEIPNEFISGKLINIDTEKFHTVGLYEYPPSDSANPILTVESDYTGSFLFDHITPGNYTITGLESDLKDFTKQIRKYKYGMLSQNFLELKKDQELENIHLYLDDPIERLKINSIEFQNSQFGKVKFSDGSEENIIIPWKSESLTEKILFSPSDTVMISLEKSNRLEKYITPDYRFLLPDILDTVPPEVTVKEFVDNGMNISFSEPIQHWKNVDELSLDFSPEFIILGFSSDDTVSLKFNFTDPMNIHLPLIPDSITTLEIPGFQIQDISGNLMVDSVLTISVNSPQEEEGIVGGSIKGNILYSGSESVVIHSENMETGEKYHTFVHNQQFEFHLLPSGNYSLWGFEILNDLDNTVYYSGTWSPYSRAARFGIYPEDVEVRARWVIEGIRLEIQ